MIATNSALLISGGTGSGKSSLSATAAEYIWETYKKKLRLYTSDLGGFPDRVENRIKQKLIEVYRVRTRVGNGGEGLVEETISRASRGWWPKTVDSHGTGDSPEAVQMVPWLAADGSQNFPHIGGLFFDGITSMSEWVLMSLRQGRASGRVSGGEKGLMDKFKSGEMSFASNNRADYGFSQGQAQEWIANSVAISGLVLPPIWTSLETTKEDDFKSLPFWGPMIAGQAKTGQVPQWVGNYIGCQTVDTPSGKEWRLYLQEYVGPDGMPHKYKCRVAPGVLPEFLADPPEEEGEPKGKNFLTRFNLGVFFGMLSKAHEEEMKKGEGRWGEIPDFSKVEIKGAPVAAPVVKPAVVAGPPALGPLTPMSGAPRPATLPPLGRPMVKAPMVGGGAPVKKIEDKDIPH